MVSDGFCDVHSVNIIVLIVDLRQRRSWPGGSRGPDPPELPSGVHAKYKNPLRIFFVRGGVGA